MVRKSHKNHLEAFCKSKKEDQTKARKGEQFVWVKKPMLSTQTGVKRVGGKHGERGLKDRRGPQKEMAENKTSIDRARGKEKRHKKS